jgi:hypothetical protein
MNTRSMGGVSAAFGPSIAARHRIGAPEIQFARAQRAKGCSWSGIAAQLSCSEPDIRALASSPDPAAPRTPPPAMPPNPLTGTGFEARLRACFRLKPEEAAMVAWLMTPAGAVLSGSPAEMRAGRALARAIRPQLGAFGLADVVEDLGGQGFVITRANARRLRLAMMAAS